MPTNARQINTFTIKELLSRKEHYIIPVYQRNYAWEAKEIEQLIQDIIDYCKHHSQRNYYIGTLVVSIEQQNGVIDFATIDGQQRLTTLSILSSVIKNKYREVDMTWLEDLNLRFESRTKSDRSMKAAFVDHFESDHDAYESNIRAAYYICERELDKKTKEYGITVKDFAEYLYQYVTILRVPLPEGTDLNHYFEIMNSRGEQLEKHEILKAKLMECFVNYEPGHRSECEACFDLIWEACANMERYVQYGFSPDQRQLIFGKDNWNNLDVYSFDEVVGRIKGTFYDQESLQVFSLEDILKEKPEQKKEVEKEESPDRFNSVVNFQNFLLHVLRVQTARDEVALDDKRLLEIFEKEMGGNEAERIAFTKEFIYNLLKCKFLFDKYIIKREFTANTDRWSLKSLKWYRYGQKTGVKYVNTFGDEGNDSFESDNRRILMLLSMFHVSIPSMVYKYWLNAALNYLFHQMDINSTSYIEYLEHIVKSFVFDRYLAKEPKDYYTMVYKDLHPIQRSLGQLDLNKLRFGQIENNLVFNFLDYLLWLDPKNKEKDNRVRTYEYTFRSSVEHYYPQNPINEDVSRIDAKYLHSFGNLCLISHEKNSRLSNFSPLNKKEYYGQSAAIDSVKQFLMMNDYKQWNTSEIEAHEKAMQDLLARNLNSSYQPDTNITKAVQWFKEYQTRNPVLLVRALYCFGDISRVESGDRYTFLDFEHMRQHEAFRKFESYINERSPKDLQEIVDKHLTYERLKKEYQYLFVKYPSVVSYCKNGKFDWDEEANGNLVYLLEDEIRSKRKSRELYTYILQDFLFQEYNTQQYADYDGLYINIGYDEDEYFIAESDSEASLELYIWNDGGRCIRHSLSALVNGNSSEVKKLDRLGWCKNEEGEFERLGKSRLLTLSNDFEQNASLLIEELKKLLRNGFAINLL